VSRVKQQSDEAEVAVMVTMSPSEAWFEVRDKAAFLAWLTPENKQWLHERLDNWLDTVKEFKR
jgi:hypothetical protein